MGRPPAGGEGGGTDAESGSGGGTGEEVGEGWVSSLMDRVLGVDWHLRTPQAAGFVNLLSGTGTP